MAKYIYNNDSVSNIYEGQEILVGAYYQIQATEEDVYANSSKLISDIGSAKAIISSTNESGGHITDVNEAINHLKDDVPSDVNVNSQPSFSDKILQDGKKLYARTHGKSFAVTAGANTLDFDIPYPSCKISGVEIINGEVGDNIDLFILDDNLGTYSTIPNYVLNQFGFDANVSKDFYNRESAYDADLYYNMCISVAYYSATAKTVYVNYILHEVKV